MYRIIIIAIVTLFIVHCNPGPDDLGGDIELNGTVYINDTVRGFAGEVALPKQVVLLKRPNDNNSLNYIYAAQSDEFGNFKFTNLSPIEYRVYSTLVRDGLTFTYDTVFTPATSAASFKAVLYPDFSNYNMLLVRTTDINGNPVPHVKVCVFTSGLLAAQHECEGNSFTLTTDQYGKAFFTQLPPAKYYLNARDSVSATVDIRVKDSVEITSATGYYSKTLSLQ
ncbi:MAG TPA: hypothetical protein VD996_02730 [Chitinophagaceae bacterium]|nr:hypothetical protein [Chitinophagaceae bacterium]